MEFGLYRHFKGKFYQVLELARHSETLEDLVVYQALYGDFTIWVRPKAMFEENVVLEDGKRVPRFAFIYSEDEDQEHDDELLTIFDSQDDMQGALKTLESHEVDFEVYEEKLKPKPEHLKSDVLYKIFVHEDDFERAAKLLT